MYIRTSVPKPLYTCTYGTHDFGIFLCFFFLPVLLNLHRGKLRGSESSKELSESIFLFYGKAMVEIVNTVSNWVKNRSK